MKRRRSDIFYKDEYRVNIKFLVYFVQNILKKIFLIFNFIFFLCLFFIKYFIKKLINKKYFIANFQT